MKKLLFIMGLITIFSACAMMKQNTTENSSLPVSGSTQQVANLTFEDLPVPSKMILDRDNSFVYETSDYRTGILFYNGNMSVVDVANFYKTEMPKYNWNLVNSLEYKKGSQLIFEKPGWIAVIRIESTWQNSSKLVITIGPKGSSNETQSK